jgi:hydrogenase maturation protease
MAKQMQTLVIGLGNPILTDDGIGVCVARAVADALPESSGIDVIEMAVGGLALMETMAGYERVVLIDALYTEQKDSGQVRVFDAGDLASTLNTASTHDADLPTALRLGRSLGALLPADNQIQIVGITAHDVLTFGETPSLPVMRAAPEAAASVLELLGVSITGRLT